MDKIDWFWLSSNFAAIHLLKENPDKIDWNMFSSNAAIFEYDYTMTQPFKDELLAVCFHPDNRSRLTLN
jgi:hypothetical protein